MSGSIERRVAILGGTGNLGRGLAQRWLAAGYQVILGSRSPDKAAAVARDMGERLGCAPPGACGYREAAASAAAVVLAVPYAAQRDTVEEVRGVLEGRILIDTTVPLVPPKVARVQLPADGAAVAAIQTLLGDTVRVVSAFQNVAAHLLLEPGLTVDCDVLVCGDDPAARETVIGMIADIGMRGLHAGPIANSAAAEALTSILISINARYKTHGAGLRITGPDLPPRP
jgi:8-hydroxy-5-deazaflavin:NADPH oxidoreductase